MLLMTASSMAVPVIGLASAPILAQGLGVDGRGESAAAIAPNLLIVGISTLGLNEAVTYFVARRPTDGARVFARAAVVVSLLGAIATVAVVTLSGYLAAGDRELARYMILGAGLAIPALVVQLMRSVASGRQMWTLVAVERLATSLLRLVVLVILLVTSNLTVLAAVVLFAVTPLVGFVAYLGVFRSPPVTSDSAIEPARTRDLLQYGSRTWLGVVALMLMGRLSQLVVTPLADVRQLGLLVVATTISDVPYIFATTIRDVVFGTSSAENNVERLAATSRVATLLTACGSLVLGGTLPWWITVVFGEGFSGSIVPTWLLLTGSVVLVAGLVAGAGVAAAGHPGLRSISLILALVINTGGLIILVPTMGAVGAALAGLLANLALTVFALGAARRVLRTPATAFFIVRRSDITTLVGLARQVARRTPLPRPTPTDSDRTG